MPDNVQVAVRVRPFNSRELALGEKRSIIRMNGPSTSIVDTKGEERRFTFDYSFDSFDPTDKNFADQDDVHQVLGINVLNNAWNGYNCSLFAYGQTGSGKVSCKEASIICVISNSAKLIFNMTFRVTQCLE